MSPIPVPSSPVSKCMAWRTEAGGVCGNTCVRAACKSCVREIALCDECGGVAEATRQMRAHESTHEIAAGAKHATCRWCDWTSADAYHPDDEYAKNRAFEQQRAHVRASHYGIYKKIAAYAAQSRTR